MSPRAYLPTRSIRFPYLFSLFSYILFKWRNCDPARKCDPPLALSFSRSSILHRPHLVVSVELPRDKIVYTIPVKETSRVSLRYTECSQIVSWILIYLCESIDASVQYLSFSFFPFFSFFLLPSPNSCSPVDQMSFFFFRRKQRRLLCVEQR